MYENIQTWYLFIIIVIREIQRIQTLKWTFEIKEKKIEISDVY